MDGNLAMADERVYGGSNLEIISIKYLAPYLPFNIKCLRNGFGQGKAVYDLDQYNYNDVINVEKCKPILRPLKNLADTNSFCSLTQIIFNESGDCLFFRRYDRDKNEIILNDGKGNAYYYGLNFEDLNCISYTFIINLCKYSYDIFGLIEKGLAIDINTLK